MRISEYRMRRRVRFYEVDGAGIVHFSCYFRYMEEAEYELWRAAGLRAAALPGIGLPRVAASFDFRRPLRFEDEFEARIQITSIREKSMAYSCVLTLGDDTIATGTMTIACGSRRANRCVRFRGRLKSPSAWKWRLLHNNPDNRRGP